MAKRTVREKARHAHAIDRTLDVAGRQGRRSLHAGNRGVDRRRGRAAGSAGVTLSAIGQDAAALKPNGSDPAGQPRRVLLSGQAVDYRLIRARRRSIGMEVHLEGLTVRAPRWVTIRDIELALVERAHWIVKSLAEWRARRRDVMPREWKTGAPILYRGRELALEVFPARQAAITADLFHLTVCHPSAHDERQVAAVVGRWLKDEARQLVVARVTEYASRIAPSPPAVCLSNAKSEWGSCNAKGEIRLN